MTHVSRATNKPTSKAVIDPVALRETAGTFATGITIITCTADGTPNGCAANAVMSLSLDPPLMFISLAETSRTRLAIETSGRFAINILPDGEQGSRLCSIFAGRTGDKFRELSYRCGTLGSPLLEEALSWLECSVESSQVMGDHTCLIGRVHAMDHTEGEPLVFFRGKNRRLAA